jgi:hypothetical protein
MENFNIIEFHKARDFSRKMNATFEFIQQNFKSLTKSILFIAGPPVLVASMLMGSFIGDFLNLFQSMGSNPGNMEIFTNHFRSLSFWLQILLMVIFLLISGIITIATVNNYIILYGEKKTNKIEVNEVWERVRSTFWMYFGTMFFFSLLGIGAYIVLLIPVGLLAFVSPLLIFFGVLFFFFALLYIVFSLSLVFFIRGYEHIGFFDSIGRSFRLVRGKWWSTFGLLMILYMIVGMISYIPIIPWYVMTLVSTIHNIETHTLSEPTASSQVLTTVFFTLYYLVNMILSALPNVGIAFQYFNLVELKESKGLMTQIETFGEPQQPSSTQDEHY